MTYERSDFIDLRGRYLTQSLFLEIDYKEEALYTLKDYDHDYNGKIYPSLKRLYLEASDPTEYQFATQHLAGWDHWQKICANKVLAQHVDKWRIELELKLRSEGVSWIIKSARKKQNWLAAKFLAERGWDVRSAGRPSKEEIEKQTKIMQNVVDEFEQDYTRLHVVNGK